MLRRSWAASAADFSRATRSLSWVLVSAFTADGIYEDVPFGLKKKGSAELRELHKFFHDSVGGLYVKLIASQGGVDLASSAVVADGSALEFQLPQALAQVSLRVQDDSGHFVTVTGYPEEVELSFVGKEVAGSANPAAAYDVTNQNDSLFPPAAWRAFRASAPGQLAWPKDSTDAA